MDALLLMVVCFGGYILAFRYQPPWRTAGLGRNPDTSSAS